MDWRMYSCAQAEARLLELYNDDGSPNDGLKDRTLNEDYAKLEKLLTAKYKSLRVDYQKLYEIDLRMGIFLYKTLSLGDAPYHMNLAEAFNTNIWRYICVEVAPEIVMLRWFKADKELPKARFYNHPTRIYLRSLWWYIHLSWQGNENDTIRILKENSTDTIVGLVERVGRRGYDVETCRMIMKMYGEYKGSMNRGDLFRNIMKLHTAKCCTIEPALCDNGREGYVRELFDNFKE